MGMGLVEMFPLRVYEKRKLYSCIDIIVRSRTRTPLTYIILLAKTYRTFFSRTSTIFTKECFIQVYCTYSALHFSKPTIITKKSAFILF